MDVIELLERLVRIDSVNPALDPRGGGEAAVAGLLASELRDLGLEATTEEALPGRPNVVAVLPGADGRAAAAAGGAHGHRPAARAADRGGH